MGRARESEQAGGKTKSRIVNAARELFLTQGYEATSISDVLDRAGANSGSLYYFFRTKEDLLIAVLDFYVDALRPYVIDPVEAHEPDPLARVMALMANYREMLVVTGFRHGCPIGNLSLEVGEKSERIREKIALNFENWRLAVRAWLTQAVERLAPGADVDRLATLILVVMEGGVMLARARREITPFDDAVAMLRDYMERLQQPAGG